MKEENDMLQSYKDRIKRQNDAVKNNYDKISCTIPKGTKDKIRSYGYSVNTFVNEAIRRYLSYLEPERPVEEKQSPVISDGSSPQTPEQWNEILYKMQAADAKKLEEEKYNGFTQEEYRDLTKTKEKFETNL